LLADVNDFAAVTIITIREIDTAGEA